MWHQLCRRLYRIRNDPAEGGEENHVTKSERSGTVRGERTDGDIDTLRIFSWTNERWIVRYLVVENGGFFSGRRCSSRHFLPASGRLTRRFHLALTRTKIKNSQVWTSTSRLAAAGVDLFGYYELSVLLGIPGLWGMAPTPLAGGWRADRCLPSPSPPNRGHHLRSAKEMRGYHIEGTDAAIGHVDDFIIDDETWAVRYLVIDTRNWWLDKKVLLAPHWTNRSVGQKRRSSSTSLDNSIRTAPSGTRPHPSPRVRSTSV